MAHPDLYQLLGVPRSAKRATIHAAYRRRAKELHPDAGGDQAQFELLKLARDTLYDPERRRRYDATGEVSPASADNSHQPGLTMLSNVLSLALGDLLKAQREPTQVDMVAALKNKIASLVSEEEKKIGALHDNVALLRRLQGRFSKKLKQSDSTVEMVIRGQIAHLEVVIPKIEETIAAYRAAAKLLEDESFRYDIVQRVVVVPSASTATIAFTAWR